MSFHDDDFGADPLEFFGTAAGPRSVDVIGPRDNILDTYVDGMPVARATYEAEDSMPNHGTGGGSPLNLGKLWGPEGMAFVAVLLGIYLVHQQVK